MATSPSTDFDIVAQYNDLIQKDPLVTPSIAAIQSLISLLSSNPLSTISETLELVTIQSEILLAAQKNPIPLSAGTDLFRRYLVSSFQQRPSSLTTADFDTLRSQLITNSRVFVQRAQLATSKIAQYGLPFIKDDTTIITFGYSRAVTTLLKHAAETGRYFKIINVVTRATAKSSASSLPPHLSIPTATIPFHSLIYALSSSPPTSKPKFVVGASAVLENGSLISHIGTHQLALLANSLNIPFYAAAESYKFLRSFPLAYGKADLERMGVQQDILHFNDEDEEKQVDAKNPLTNEADMIDITPPHLVSALITENGTMTPNAVSEELIKLWF